MITVWTKTYMPLVNITPKEKYFKRPFTRLNSGFKHRESTTGFGDGWLIEVDDEKHRWIGLMIHFIPDRNWSTREFWVFRSETDRLWKLLASWARDVTDGWGCDETIDVPNAHSHENLILGAIYRHERGFRNQKEKSRTTVILYFYYRIKIKIVWLSEK